MVLKYRYSITCAAFLFALAGFCGCEDNPDECYRNSDCPNGCVCKATYYYSGERSGGYCQVPDGAVCEDKRKASTLDKAGNAKNDGNSGSGKPTAVDSSTLDSDTGEGDSSADSGSAGSSTGTGGREQTDAG
jgi:hypothetical protein